VKLRHITDELDVHWHRGRVERVDPERHVVITDRGCELAYDHLVIAVGAHEQRPWRADDVLTYRDAQDASEVARLVRQLEAGRVTRVAFVEPAGPAWPLPLYELAFATAAVVGRAARWPAVELSLTTPAPAPLAIFGTDASATVAAALEEVGVRVHTSTTAIPSRPGRLHLAPGDRRLAVDRVVTVPRLAGPRIVGVPSDPGGFIPTDMHGRVMGASDLFAAGDATAFPVKQGGLAAQQADAIAELIASSVGAAVRPRPFRPVLRGILRADGAPHYMRAPLTAGSEQATISRQPLWWPPNRLCGRYLAPYLTRAGGAGVMFHGDGSAWPPRARATGTGSVALMELADLASTTLSTPAGATTA
jgi:sulfide:quinone oxidoreductase